jgi:hypothetical protein
MQGLTENVFWLPAKNLNIQAWLKLLNALSSCGDGFCSSCLD